MGMAQVVWMAVLCTMSHRCDGMLCNASAIDVIIHVIVLSVLERAALLVPAVLLIAVCAVLHQDSYLPWGSIIAARIMVVLTRFVQYLEHPQGMYTSGGRKFAGEGHPVSLQLRHAFCLGAILVCVISLRSNLS